MRRSVALLILAVSVLGLAALLVPPPAHASSLPCVYCPPKECGPCETYTGDTCYTCGGCKHIPGCHAK
jgi:hypothetical protein